mgnify:CR=1 FL=1
MRERAPVRHITYGKPGKFPVLGAKYAQHFPLTFSANIAKEQSYGLIDGDSASLAEVCARISGIADIPITQSLAVTGSINQHGQVQAIGGVNEKIEGYFRVCKQIGLRSKSSSDAPLLSFGSQHCALCKH